MQLLGTLQTELSKKHLTLEEKTEILRCSQSCAYFISRFAYIYNATESAWVPFDLWPMQEATLVSLHHERLALVLKARQLGLSWLVIGYALWLMLYRPQAAVLIFSQRDEEAIELLGRLKGVYERLPEYMQAEAIGSDNKHEFSLANGSSAKSFPTTAGRSYTGTMVIVDEADFLPDLESLLNAVKPTIDAGGKMILISTADKSQPESTFKRIYRAARKGENEWTGIFLPWQARPARDEHWYERIKADIVSQTGALDNLFQEYPATDTEALAPRSLDKRISPMWIEACFDESDPMPAIPSTPVIAGLDLFKYRNKGQMYVIGADPAEGNPSSDDSAATVMDVATGEEVACLAGKFEPAVFGSHLVLLSHYFNDAAILVERNNHGHAVIQWLQENAPRQRLLPGHDQKTGWMSSKLGKALLWTEAADHFLSSSQAETKILHSFASYSQIASIDGSTLRAPEGQHDDRAVSFALAQCGRLSLAANQAIMRQGLVRGRGGGPMVRRGRASKDAPIGPRNPALFDLDAPDASPYGAAIGGNREMDQ